MKVLVVNSDSAQLKEDASSLHKYGFTTLIANDLMLSGRLALKKKPDIILLYLSKSEYESGNTLLESLTSFSGLIILISNDNPHYADLPLKSFELLVLDKNHASLDILTNICHRHFKETDASLTNDIGSIDSKEPILIVEDNKLNQFYYGEILNKLNLNYVATDCLSEALRIIEKKRFKLLIVDAILKDGNGIELIKKIMPQSKTAIIIVSGYSQQELSKTHGTFECDCYLAKPIKEEDFSNAVIRCLEMEKSNKFSINNPKYHYDEMFSLLKYDKIKVETSLNEFLSILNNSMQLTKNSLDSKDYEGLRQIFHEVLNLCAYYGANLLFDLVMEFKHLENENEKEFILLKIEKEQKSVFLFYSELLKALDESLTSLKSK